MVTKRLLLGCQSSRGFPAESVTWLPYRGDAEAQVTRQIPTLGLGLSRPVLTTSPSLSPSALSSGLASAPESPEMSLGSAIPRCVGR